MIAAKSSDVHTSAYIRFFSTLSKKKIDNLILEFYVEF